MCERGVLDLIMLYLELDIIDSYPELEMYSDDEVCVSTPG